MPVQINEVIIRTVVEPSGKDAAGCAPPGNTDGSASSAGATENELAEQLINIIKEKQER